MQPGSVNEGRPAAPKQQMKQTVRKQDFTFTATPHAVLLHSNRHNLQPSSGNHVVATPSKGRKSFKKADGGCVVNNVIEANVKNTKSPSSTGKEGSSKPCSSAKLAASKPPEPAEASEVDELKRRLHEANMQIAEVVAQSAILVRDVQCAASKEIAGALQHMQPSTSGESKQFTSTASLVQYNPVPSRPGRGSLQMGVGTTEQELAATRRELIDCKSMLAELRMQLERTSFEKDKLEMYLRSSLQTSLKLQDTLMNQKSVMQLELLATEERCRNEASTHIESARNEAKVLQDELDKALLAKEETDTTFRNCFQLLCYAHKELWIRSTRQPCYFDVAIQEKLHQLEVAQRKVEADRDNLEEACAHNLINWTVLECVWEGAVKSLLESDTWFAKPRMPVESPEYWKHIPRRKTKKFLCSIQEDLTPLKPACNSSTPRSAFPQEDELGRPCESLQWEDTVRRNLLKSEYEVEVLGDKVDELWVILEKVTSLLDCISKSSITGLETKVLMRRIAEQLQAFGM